MSLGKHRTSRENKIIFTDITVSVCYYINNSLAANYKDRKKMCKFGVSQWQENTHNLHWRFTAGLKTKNSKVSLSRNKEYIFYQMDLS